PMMALVILLLTHLIIFAPFSPGGKIAFITTAFLSGLFNESASWLVRFVHPEFAWLKIASFLTLQGSLIFLLISLGLYLYRAWKKEKALQQEHSQEEDFEEAVQEEQHLP
ncbi:MAG: hypothetical protein WEB62_10995, partial [Bacteroidota bacterium]